MKTLNVLHKDIQYEFRLLEQVSVIEVKKGGRFTYLIKWASTFFRFNCPGGTFHGKCWHSEMIGMLKKQESINEPWAEWAEEAGVMKYAN